MKEDPDSTQIKLSKFLIKYRNTPHSTTGEIPATLVMGRKLRTRLDLIKPGIRKHVTDKQVSQAKPKGAIASHVRQLFIVQAKLQRKGKIDSRNCTHSDRTIVIPDRGCP